MRKNHVVLLLEDNDAEAALTARWLEGMGHRVIRARTREEAEVLAAKGEHCYQTVDLEVPNREGQEALTVVGHEYIGSQRELRPAVARGTQCHVDPIVVVSGHLKDHPHVALAYQRGADASVTKPVPNSNPSLTAEVERVLRESGREDHTNCARRNIESRATSAARTKRILGISGRIGKYKRRFIELDGKTIPLRTSSLLMVVRLVLGRLDDPADGGVSNDDLGMPPQCREDGGWDVPRRLREDLRPFVEPDLFLDNEHGSGTYRIHLDIEIAWSEIGVDALVKHPNKDVKSAALELQKHLQPS